MLQPKDFSRWNAILGWFSFVFATLVYLMTMEPTASWWGCGEYIATAYKLQVGHPPGAPTFQLAGRLFSMMAFGDTSKVALMINAMSAICSGLTIMFLFWTITLLALKVMKTRGNLTPGSMLAVLGSGLVGAMAFTFSDSFWFSATEGEVYAMSGMFTAITFWAILRWEAVADEGHSLRWLILIAYLVGLSIGIHLLNLLAIPAIAYVYYYKRYKPSTRGFLFTGALSILILAVIMYLIIPGIVKLAGNFELFFINSIRLPFNSGTFIYFIALFGGLYWAQRYTVKKRKSLLNTVVLSLVFLLIGYSSFFMLIIRSNANTPIDENSPEDAVSLLSYLNREQYGYTPLFFGPYYNAPVVDYKDGTPVYIKDKAKRKYVVTDDRKQTIPQYDNRFETIFPRMWSNQKSEHIRYYKDYGNVRGTPVQVRKPDGTTATEYCPTFSENLRFFFSYQLGHMYFRYFMWNFAGRQNEIESQGEPEHGNWISGFGFIDNPRLGDQSNLPASMDSPARNRFYLLPLLLGLAGLVWQFRSSRKDTWVVFLLFLMTGIAIVVYLNQYPLQPRERDYAYAGSFYAFAVWIGLGVMLLYDYLAKFLKQKEPMAAIAVTVLCIALVPGIMGSQGWDDHDRSGKYAARDFASNYLRGCDKESVLVTFGDNDTFPLWYAQEVEGFRTDVRVLNHMLASGHWYSQQMFNKVYDSDPLPLTLGRHQYENGVNNYIPIVESPGLADRYTELKDLIKFIASEDDRSKVGIAGGKKLNFLPTRKIRMTVDARKCVENGIVPRELADQIVPYIEWEIKQSAIFKNDLLILDFLATSDWTRALYFSNPSSLNDILGIDQYIHQEGMVYKFMPVKAKNFYPEIGGVNAEKTYEIFNDCKWGNLEKPGVLIDRESGRNIRVPRQNFLRAAEVFVKEGKKEKAIELLDKCLYYFPSSKVNYDMFMLPIAETYYEAGGITQANRLVTEIADLYGDDLRYYTSLDADFAEAYYGTDIQRAMSILKRLAQVARQYKQEDIAMKVEAISNLYGG